MSQRLVIQVSPELHDRLEELIPTVWRFCLANGRTILPMRGVDWNQWPELEIVHATDRTATEYGTLRGNTQSPKTDTKSGE